MLKETRFGDVELGAMFVFNGLWWKKIGPDAARRYTTGLIGWFESGKIVKVKTGGSTQNESQT